MSLTQSDSIPSQTSLSLRRNVVLSTVGCAWRPWNQPPLAHAYSRRFIHSVQVQRPWKHSHWHTECRLWSYHNTRTHAQTDRHTHTHKQQGANFRSRCSDRDSLQLFQFTCGRKFLQENTSWRDKRYHTLTKTRTQRSTWENAHIEISHLNAYLSPPENVQIMLFFPFLIPTVSQLFRTVHSSVSCVQ